MREYTASAAKGTAKKRMISMLTVFALILTMISGVVASDGVGTADLIEAETVREITESPEQGDPAEDGGEPDVRADGQAAEAPGDAPEEDEPEPPAVFCGFWMLNAEVALGDLSFDLLDGVSALDCLGDPIEGISVLDDGGFDPLAEGEYVVVYEAADPVDGAVYRDFRTLTVRASDAFAFYEQLTGEDGRTVVEAEAGKRHLVIEAGESVEIRDTEFDGKGLGGGIEVQSGAELVLINCVIVNCAAELGGGIYAAQGSAVTLYNSRVIDSAAARGGGVYLAQGALLRLENNKITVIVDGEVTSDGSAVDGNRAVLLGGGIYMETGAQLEISEGTSVNGNTAGSSGGGIYAQEKNRILLDGGEIAGNRADTQIGLGGGVALMGGELKMTGGRIDGNEARLGGGVYLHGGGEEALWVSDGEISGNRAYRGGGVYCTGADMALRGGAVAGNNATFGGGVYLRAGYASGAARQSARATVYGAEIRGNVAEADGGGVYAELAGGDFRSELALQAGAQVSGNHAGLRGGGVFAGDYSYVTASEGVAFAENGAALGVILVRDPELIDLHNQYILTDRFTDGMQYAYNNYDIGGAAVDVEIREHTVTFDAGEGAPAPEPQTVEHGALLEEPEAPSLSGHSFAGWFIEGADAAWDFDRDRVEDSFTLFARYVEDDPEVEAPRPSRPATARRPRTASSRTPNTPSASRLMAVPRPPAPSG